MKLFNSILGIPIILGFLVLNWNCTESPVGEDNEIVSNTISGMVELSDNASPDSAYVWFKTFDVSARTDQDGFFELTLPPIVQPRDGLDGIFSLYFYVANYQIDSVNIVLVNGKIQNSAGALNDKGEISEPVRLFKILDINTSIDQPIFIKTSEPDTVIFTFTVRAIGKPVWVTSSVRSSTSGPEFMRGFVRKADSGEKFIKKVTMENLSVQSPTFQIENFPTQLERMYLIYEPGIQLPAGEYEAIPYLLIHQDMPSGLLKSIGENVEAFDPVFLRIPLKVRNNKFVVREQ